MSGVCIDKLPHSCGTRKGLQVFADTETGKVNGYCFSCKTFVANPYGEEKTIDDVELPEEKTPEQIQQEIAEVSGYDVVDLPSRKLRASNLKNFGVKVALSEEDGKTPTHMYVPTEESGALTGYYVKTLSSPSHSWAIGDVKNCDLIGWDRAKNSGAYRLIITEGPEDAVATERIHEMYTKDSNYTPAVVSLPNGVNSVKRVLTKHAKEINRLFGEVILCFDDDEAGRAALEDAFYILPKALSVTLPTKDANEALIKGAAKAAYNAFAFKKEKPTNTRLIMAKDLFVAAREPTPYGSLTWPYQSMNQLLRNMRTGETIYVGAGVKMGKSELVNDIGAHLIMNHGVPVFMAKPEEQNKKTVKMVAGKMVGYRFHDPEVEFDYDLYDKATKQIDDKLILLDLYQHMGWDSLKQDIVAAASMGAKVVFIDPITNLTNGMSAADANSALGDIAQDLSAMAKDLDIVVFIFCHLKAPEGNLSKDARTKKYKEGTYVGLGNCPHEFGGDVLSSQFAGSRSMMRSCNLMLGLEGNKDPMLEDKIRNMRWLTILEDREFGNTGRIPLYYNTTTTKFKEA